MGLGLYGFSFSYSNIQEHLIVEHHKAILLLNRYAVELCVECLSLIILLEMGMLHNPCVGLREPQYAALFSQSGSVFRGCQGLLIIWINDKTSAIPARALVIRPQIIDLASKCFQTLLVIHPANFKAFIKVHAQT